MVTRNRSHFHSHVTTPTVIYTLSLHDALPIYAVETCDQSQQLGPPGTDQATDAHNFATTHVEGDVVDAIGRNVLAPYDDATDRKSTRLNSSHMSSSYAVFCLKKKII